MLQYPEVCLGGRRKLFLVVRRKPGRCHFSAYGLDEDLSFLMSCLFGSVWSSSCLECNGYFCIKCLQWYLLFCCLTWGERGRKRSHHLLNLYSARFSERRKLQGQKKRPHDYFPFSAGVQRCPFSVSVVCLPQNMRLTSKFPCTSEMTNTVLPSVHPEGTLPKYLNFLLLASRFKAFGSSQRLQFHVFQYNSSRG